MGTGNSKTKVGPLELYADHTNYGDSKADLTEKNENNITREEPYILKFYRDKSGKKLDDNRPPIPSKVTGNRVGVDNTRHYSLVTKNSGSDFSNVTGVS